MIFDSKIVVRTYLQSERNNQKLDIELETDKIVMK